MVHASWSSQPVLCPTQTPAVHVPFEMQRLSHAAPSGLRAGTHCMAFGSRVDVSQADAGVQVSASLPSPESATAAPLTVSVPVEAPVTVG